MQAFRVVKVYRDGSGKEELLYKLVAPSYDDALRYLEVDFDYVVEPNEAMILLLSETPSNG